MSEVVKIYGLDFALINKAAGTDIQCISRFRDTGSGTEPTPPTPPSWQSIFDDTKWEGWYGDGAPHDTWWSTNKWCCGDWYYEIHLKPIGTWAIGFRPTKVRVTINHSISGPGNFFLLRKAAEAGEPYIASSEGYVSLTELDCTFDEDDIGSLFIPMGDGDCAGNCTNIEFYA
jgi:hypothetical protein